MRQVLPTPADEVVVSDCYARDERPARPGRPWVVINMIASIDGSTAVAGRSGGLGTPADHQVFTALRALADVIVVGAGTVRAEGYGPPRTPQAEQERRVARGQSRFPRIAVVTGRLDLDLSTPLFTESVEPPIILTGTAASAEARAAVTEVADVHVVGEAQVDLARALAALAGLGAGVALCEGGPLLNDQLLAEALIDEICLSVSPMLAGGESARIIHGSAPATPMPMRLDRALEEDGMLLLRYVRA